MMNRDELRLLIRDVIEAEVSNQRRETAAENQKHSARIACDADLNSFARHVLSLAENMEIRGQIQSGRYPFQLEANTSTQVMAVTHNGSGVVRDGVITEATLSKLPKGIRSLELGPGAVVTPLAKERARALGIVLERRRT